MPKKIYNSSQAPKPIGPYSQAVAAGGFLFLSGQTPIDPETGEVVAGDIEGQTERARSSTCSRCWKEAGSRPGERGEDDGLPGRHERLPRMNEVYARATQERAAGPHHDPGRRPAGNVQVEIDLIAASERPQRPRAASR